MDQRHTPPDEFPQTVADAVDWLLAVVPEETRRDIARMRKADLIGLHFGLGMYIRNQLGLWGDNEALLNECGGGHPDDVSGVIIEALWRRLRQDRKRAAP